MPELIDSDTTYNGNSGSIEANKDGLRVRFKLTFIVLADSVNDRESDIRVTEGIPALSSYLRGAKCKKIQVSEIDTNALLWKVTCDFDSKIDQETDSSNNDEANLPPELRSAKWSWGGNLETRDLLKDAITDDIIVNALGEPLPGTVKYHVPVLNLTWYQLRLGAEMILKYSNKTNSVDFLGMPKKTVLSGALTDSEVELTWSDGDDANGNPLPANTFKYREVKLSLEFYIETDENDALVACTTCHRPLHIATKYLLDSADEIDKAVPFKDAFGQRASHGIIDEEGLRPLQSPGGSISSENQFLEFNAYKTIDFNDLRNIGGIR